ncbi:MAG: hypothetical protein GXY86_16665 [Firmicutes bacterium]|nr:hypothetical protein [Bacillota bacterium]
MGMKLIAALCLALGLAWIWGRFLRFIKLDQKIRIGIGMPLGEEAIKFSLALAFDYQPLLVYLLFGFGEGLLESFLLKKPEALKLILAGGLTHFGFGVFFLFPVPPVLSFGLAIILHFLWNNLLLKNKAI